MRSLVPDAARHPDPHNPYELTTMVGCAFSAIFVVGAKNFAPAFYAAVPPWGRYLWVATLVAGAALDIYGIASENYRLRPFIQQIGVTMFAAACIFYAGIVWRYTYFGFGVGMTLAFGIASAFRAIQLQYLIRAIKQQSREEVQQ